MWQSEQQCTRAACLSLSVLSGSMIRAVSGLVRSATSVVPRAGARAMSAAAIEADVVVM